MRIHSIVALFCCGFLVASTLTASTIDWVREYNGPGNDPDRIAAIAVDLNGDVIVAGTSTVPGTQEDLAIIKFSPSGDTIWVRHFDYPVAHGETCVALAINGNGNIIVTGTTYSVATGRDLITAKLSNDGSLLWYRIFDGATHADDYSAAVVTDPLGNVYITGSTGAVSDWPTLEDYVTIKYSSSGAELWVHSHDGSLAGSASGMAVALDSSGNLLVTGVTSGLGSDQDITTIKYRRSNFCGDADGSGLLNISDAVYLILYIFSGGPAPNPLMQVMSTAVVLSTSPTPST